MPKLPPHVKMERAKVVVTTDGRKLILKSCADCAVEFYGTEKYSALTRDKWEGREDYRERTFKKARETYKKHKLEKEAATAGAMIADVSTNGEESDYDED